MKNCSLKLVCLSLFVWIVLMSQQVAAQNIQDAAIKSQVNNLKGATAMLNKLQPQSFMFNNQDFPYLDMPSGIQYGFNADQVQTVLPSLVYQQSGKRLAGKNLYKDYTKKQVDEVALIPFLVASIHEMHSEINLLKEEVARLKK